MKVFIFTLFIISSSFAGMDAELTLDNSIKEKVTLEMRITQNKKFYVISTESYNKGVSTRNIQQKNYQQFLSQVNDWKKLFTKKASSQKQECNASFEIRTQDKDDSFCLTLLSKKERASFDSWYKKIRGY